MLLVESDAMQTKYIKARWEKLLLGSMAACCLIISLFDFLGLLDSISWISDRIPAVTLFLISLIATYLIFDHQSKFELIHKSIDDGFALTNTALGAIKVEQISGEEKGFTYLTDSILTATSTIELVSLAPALDRSLPSARIWEKTIENVLQENKVEFRYIFNGDSARIKRVSKHLGIRKYSKFHAGFLYFSPSSPLPGFCIVDDKKVVVTFPTERGRPQIWVNIENHDMVRAYTAYFNRLWVDAHPITTVEEANRLSNAEA